MPSTNCSVAMTFINSPWLRFALGYTTFLPILSMISLILTSRKLRMTVHIDRPFKVYLFFCYGVLSSQNCCFIVLHTTLLLQYTFWPFCEVQLPRWFCYGIRFTGALSLSCLIYMNVAITLFRLIVFLNPGIASRRQEMLIGILGMLAISSSFAEAFYKYNAFDFSGTVTYCSANQSGIFSKLNIFAYVLFCIEISVVSGGLILRNLYQKEMKQRKSYDVNTGLSLRQIAHTFQIFLPFSITHSSFFLCWLLFSVFYRLFYGSFPDDVYYSFSLILYAPIYFSVLAPWLLFSIVKRAEMVTISKTSNLLAREADATNLYFQMNDEVWGNGKGRKMSVTSFRTKVLLKISRNHKVDGEK
ncbi:unnamed protein product, partial [Mesorhabditis belari]|uniref:Uncharacterized protein n=1 Tax=Mesorhabditis belari TaxID=2138241 RepID=A0AAF3FJL5_9BILA